ncbi:hypothetical protein KC318_g22381, partial [Hortaea werneckii]
RPLLRGVVRPEVKIPARKRRRLEIEEAPHANDEVDANEGAVVKFGDLDEEDEESEDDGDFEIEEEEEEDSEESLDEAESEASSEASGESGRESEESSDSDTSSSSDDTSDDDDSSGSESWDGIQSGPHSPGLSVSFRHTTTSQFLEGIVRKGYLRSDQLIERAS